MANNFVPVIIGKSAITGNEDSAILINGFSVSDNDNPSSLRVKVGVSHGSLALTTTTGITGTTAGASLEFEGSIANLNTALNSLTYQSNLNYSGADGLTVQVSDDNGVSWHDYLVDQPGKFYNSNNGHYYEFVNATGITWAAAKTAAESRTVYGLNGYLTTVTSQLENDFIKPKLGGIRWMGSSDAATEGDWRWVTGPEAGTQFWSGNGSGSAIGGLYNNWYSGEPNNYGAGENYGLFYQADKWADAPNNFLNYAIGYVVEYGGTGFGTLQTVPLTVTVNAVNDAPVLNNLSGDAATTTINQVVLIDIGTVVTITDVDTTNFNGGTLVITTTSGTANGSFSLDGANAASGGNNTVAAGETITVGGTTIGTVHATNDGQNGRTLTITLNSNATTTNVATLIKNIGFESATAGLRNFNLALSESDGQTANAAFSVDVQNNPMVKGRSSVAGNEDTPISITGLTVSDADNPASLTVKIAANQGSLTLGTTTGITGTTSGNSLQFSGSIANLNTALGGLSYQGNLNYSGTDDLTIQVSDDSGASWHDYFVDQVGKFYNPNNSHYYEYVSIYGIDWASAKAAAESRTLYGLNGYLATITLQSESDYITARLGGSGWFGASDAAIEGDWRWVTGPEAGTQFWSGAANGSAVNGRYSHWISGEPNDQSGEDYPNLLLNGFWNDVPGNTPGIQGYIVEYGGTGFGTLGTVPLTVTVNAVNDAPILNNLNGDAAATTVNWAVPIDTGTAVTITDGDTTNFNGGTLVITTTSGTANGSFSLDGANAASGGNHTLAAGETVTVGGTTIGTVHATNDGQNGHTLTVTLNSNATTTNVSEFIKNIGYQSATVGLRNFNLALSESDGKTTNAAFSVNVQDAPSIKGRSSVAGNEDTPISISGLTVSDANNPASLTVKIAANYGTLTLGTTAGITGTTSGSTLQFSGSIADLNTALGSLSYQGNLDYSGTDDLTIQVSDDNGVSWHDYFVDQVGKFYNPNNGHYYEYVSASGIDWSSAKTAAEGRTLYGLNGYLATITSQSEGDYIAARLGGSGWFGASDAATEGDWRWVTGPEAGTQFWSGAANGSSVSGQYNHWESADPNNLNGIEDHARLALNGFWNDLPENTPAIQGYVVEYGGTGFGALGAVPLTVTVNAASNVPSLNNLNGDVATTAVNQFVLIDTGAAVTITDSDSTNFNGGTLIITTTSGTGDGSFSLDGVNAVSGGNNIIAVSETITVGGTTIGTVHATNDGQNGRTLTITLNSNATRANVSELIKNIGFESATAGLRSFNLALSENGGQATNAAFSVDVQENPMIKGRSSVAGNEDTPISISGLTVSDASNLAILTVKIVANHGSLALGTTAGITGATSGSALQFSGSVIDLNTALGSLSYQGNLDYSGTDDLAIQVSDDNGVSWHDYFVDQVGKFYNPNNGHYYEHVSASGIDWASAKAAAEGRTLYGLNGYLATITSQSEGDYIAARLGGSGWFGASDAATEGDWRWVTGPEAGTQFWSGAANGSSVSGQYNHWESADPNNLNGIEDHARLALNGFWNDLPENTPGVQGYIVEYGGTGFGILGAVPLTVTVNAANDAPVLSNLSGDAAATTVNWAVPIDTGTAVTTTDVDATNFNGGTLVITTTSGTADGSFSLDGVSAASGGNNTLAAGETVTVGGIAIGVIHALNDGQNGRTLTVTLNSTATTTNVSEFIKNINYQSATVGLRNFNLALSESDGQATNAAFSVDVRDDTAIKGRSSVSGNEDEPISISGLTVSDANNPAILTVKIVANHGSLALGTTAGITGATSGSALQFSGSVIDLNTALGSLSYQGNLDYSGTDDLTIQVSDDNGVSWHDYFVDQVGKFYNPNNGHYYEYVSASGIDWSSAKTAAEGRTLYGLNGYLATITSQSEGDYIAARLGGSGWFGASDAATEGDWRWVTGPEAGTQFWSGAANGSSVSGQYNHWESADPNNLNGIEDHARLALNGFWNDLPENTPGVQGYVVEYGGTGFGALGAVPLTITVNTVNDAPVLNNLNGDVAATTVNRAVPIDTGTAATITDVDATDFNMGTLVITTTSGTANGSFSLDGVSAASGGNNKLAAGETVTVGGVAIGTVHATNDGQNGRTLTITLNGGATVANVSELIKSIGYKSATAGLRDFNLALSESNGQTTNAVFSIRIQKTSSNTTSSIVDGDTVRITKTNSDDMIVTATTASIVDSSRIEDTTTQHRTLADIPLANDQNGQPTLLASLPVGVGFTSESMSSKKLLTLRDHLIHASQPRINNEVIFDGVLHNGIDKYVETVVDENQATIRTITFTSKANQAIEEAIIIKGASGAGEDDPNNPLRHEALVIDTRNLPKGTEIRLDNAEFAIIVGSGRFVGGSGRNYVVADEADQFIALGAGDDVLRGGDGNDTIGSRGGNDQLFGDNGNDHLVGGEGNDILNGGDGNDLLQGETSNAGNVTYSLDSQGNVLSTLHPLDLALADPVSTDWYSDKGRVTSDDRVAFVYRDINQLKIISTLYQAVTHQLPTTEEMNYWSSQKISATQASQIAYNHYLVVSGGVAGQATEIQLSQLIDYVWGAGSANDDLVNRGIEFLDNGGSWGDALLYLASHENLTNQLRDLNGNLQLTQDLLIGEVGISVDGGDDTLNGGLGDDVLVGGGGHNFIDGGDGIDTVHVMEGLSAHHIALTKDGLISIARNDGQAINDLRSVEKIVFSDQTLDINFANLDAQTLKQVASITHLMDRNANLWTQLDHFASSNLTINEYSQSLMQSSSHQEDWAALSNQEFVVQLSEAVLGQPLAGDDLNYWTDQLDQGLSQRSDLFVTAVGVNEYQNALFANDGLILL